MKIRSNFVDYYDYLSHVYGADEKVFFNRIDTGGYAHDHIGNTMPYINVRDRWRENDPFYYGLAVCGRYWMLYSDDSIHYLNPKSKYQVWMKQHNYFSYRYQRLYGAIYDVSRAIKTPIFLFTVSGKRINVIEFAPKLMLTGFPEIMPAEQLYQDLAYYIANVIEDGIDLRPPTEIADIDKVVQYGFDKKQSFRHRK